MRGLCVCTVAATEADVLTLAADVAAHAWLQRLCLYGARVAAAPASLNAILDAALSRRLSALHIMDNGPCAASAPALARLLGGEALRELALWGGAAPLLSRALRANSTLTSLQLGTAQLWADADAALPLLGALTAHGSLRALTLPHNAAALPAQRTAAGAALGALLAVNAPALTELNVSCCHLGDDGMGPIMRALPRNTHLRALACPGNHMSDAFAADVLLPAVRANTSLRTLVMHVIFEPQLNAAREAEDVVNARRDAVAR